jgi:hypothetical protein
VFIALTGHAAEPEGEEAGEPDASPQEEVAA